MQNDRDTKEALDRWSDSNPNHVTVGTDLRNRMPDATPVDHALISLTAYAALFDANDLVAPFAVWQRTVVQPVGLAGWDVTISWGQVIESEAMGLRDDRMQLDKFKFYPISNDHVELLKLTIMHGMRKLKVTQLYYDILEGRTP